MKGVRFLFHFLGGIHFALALIVFVLLFVIVGTFLEAWSDSHLFAAHFTFQNPLFKTLLWLFFINILFAALRRYPFQKKHIPFLLTHLGLLMILGGTLFKSYGGIQGTLGLTEGSGTEFLFLPQTQALHVESPDQCFLIPFKKARLGKLATPFPYLEVVMLAWSPHAEEELEGWIKGEALHILGFPPIPLGDPDQPTPSLRSEERDYYAFRASDPETLIKSLTLERPALVVVQDPHKNETLYAWDGRETLFERYPNDSILIFNKGFGGYALYFPPLDLYTPLTYTHTEKDAPPKREASTPRIRLLVSEGKQSEMVSLTYDRFASGLKWPVLGGKYLMRFQAQRERLPHHIRLREARQINYAASEQPFSFEADLLIDNQEATLSMNHVHQTKDGYRFYLANLSHPSPFSSKSVQIVVNRDPAKYGLTYPGGVVLALGIFLLYLRRQQRV